MIIQIPEIKAGVLDNRNLRIKGDLSDKNDIEEAFRTICAHFSQSISEAKAFSEVKAKTIKPQNLMILCKQHGLIFLADYALDYFVVKYQEDSETAPVKVKESLSDETIAQIEEDQKKAEQEEIEKKESKIASASKELKMIDEEIESERDEEEDLF